MLTVTSPSKPYIAEIGNIDLSQPLDDATFGQIVSAWKACPVLVFRDQDLDPDSQQAFAARFGPLAGRSRPLSARGKNVQDNPYLMIVTNIRDADGELLGSGDNEQAFHTAVSVRCQPWRPFSMVLRHRRRAAKPNSSI
jgi:taurine dioxygenase